MNNEELKNIWLEKFKTVPQSLQNMQQVRKHIFLKNRTA